MSNCAGSIRSVQNIAALDAVDATSLDSGTLAWVQSVGDYFSLHRSSSLSTTAMTVRMALGVSAGQWVRINVPNRLWQSQLTWSVDPSNSTGLASDETSGVDDSHPLLTWGELGRRVDKAIYNNGTSCIVRLLSDTPDTDVNDTLINVRGIGTAGGTVVSQMAVNGFFTVVGVPSVVHSGTISSPTQAAKGTAGRNYFTDAGAPSFTITNRLWKRTNGTAAYFWPLKDEGSGVWRISQPTSVFAQATLADGDSYEILQMPILRRVRFVSTPEIGQVMICFCYVNDGSASTIWPMARWDTCQFGPSAPLAGRGQYHNCADFNRFGSTQIDFVSISGGAVRTTQGSSLSIPAGSHMTMLTNANLYTSLQGVFVFVDYNSSLDEAQLMVNDLTTSAITLNRANSRAFVTNMGGYGNSGKIIDVTGTHCAAVVSSTTPPDTGMTSDGSPYRLGASTSASPALTDTTNLSLIRSL